MSVLHCCGSLLSQYDARFKYVSVQGRRVGARFAEHEFYGGLDTREDFAVLLHQLRKKEKKEAGFFLELSRVLAFFAEAFISRNPRRTPRVEKFGVFSIHWYNEYLSVVTLAATTDIAEFRIRTVHTLLCEIKRSSWCMFTPLFGVGAEYVETSRPARHVDGVSSSALKLSGFIVSVLAYNSCSFRGEHKISRPVFAGDTCIVRCLSFANLARVLPQTRIQPVHLNRPFSISVT